MFVTWPDGVVSKAGKRNNKVGGGPPEGRKPRAPQDRPDRLLVTRNLIL